MCGIFGFHGKGSARKIIRQGLQALEYRGYDSCGYAMLSDGGMQINRQTGKGQIAGLVSEIPECTDEKIRVISHTRWATHGKVSLNNSHPHCDCGKRIAVVHNGIIENYTALKSALVKKGHEFVSETDTEVIAHLVEENAKHLPFREAVLKALNELEGSFALLLLSSDNPGITGARRGSPLLAGEKEGNFFISSDLNSLMGHTDKIIFFEDGEMFMADGAIDTFDMTMGNRVVKNVSVMETHIRKANMGTFESYMKKEIFEQPEVLDKTFKALNSEFPGFCKTVDGVPERIIIVSCGSSWHAGLIGEYMMEDFLRIPVEVEYASEFRYRNPVFLPGDMVIPISQSGETADTMGAVKQSKGKAKIFSICNAYNSSIARESDYVLYTQAGPEIGVASTKTFTSQIAALYFLTLLLAFKMGKLTKYSLQKRLENLKKVSLCISRILSDLSGMEIIADKLQDKSNALFLGRGMHFPIALEGALKMKEVSYIHAEGYPAAEMKHGPIALIDENMPVVFLSAKDRFSKKVLSNMEEIKSRGGHIITVKDYISEDICRVSDEIIDIPGIEDEYLKPILTVIPLQLLAYFTAVKRGCDVDKPRNLAKSVTVE